MPDFQLRLRDLLVPVEVQTGKVNRFVVSPFAGGLLEMEDVNFHFDSAVLLPNQSSDAGTTAEQDTITGIDVLATCLLQAEERSDEVLLIAGHTDREGDASYNVALSQLRADNVLHALLGNRADWAKVSNSKYQIEDYQQILKWVSETFGFDCDPGEVDGKAGTQTFVALKSFQTQYSELFSPAIAANGVLNEETWRAFFDMYMEELKSSLGLDDAGLSALRGQLKFVDAAKRSVGCGFNHPVDKERLTGAADAAPAGVDGPSFRSAKDRRVELLFFPPADVPQLDCHPAANKCNPLVCEIYANGSRQFEFDYIRVAKITVVDFFVRPALDDAATETPHNAIIAPGDAVILHFSVQNCDRVEIAATLTDGSQSLVALTAGGRVTLSATAQLGQVSLTPSEDTIFTLKAFNGGRRVEHPVSIDVHLLEAVPSDPSQFVTNADSIDLVAAATPLEVATRTINIPDNDTRIAGPVTATKPPLLPPGRTNAVAPTASSPKLLRFEATRLFMEDMEEPNMRAQAVKTIRDFNAFGVGNLPKGRRDAYGDLISFDESKGMRAALLKKTVTNSSCALVIRSLWRLLGARDFVRKDQKKPTAKGLVDELLLEPPFQADGLLIARLLRFARLCKALHDMDDATEIANFKPKPGDVIFVTKTVEKLVRDAKGPVVKDGKHQKFSVSQQHIFTVIKVVGKKIFSVDGGQAAPKTLADGTKLTLDDGSCNGIWPHVRTLNDAPSEMVLVDRSGLADTELAAKNTTGTRLAFKGESRAISAWIELPKLRFSGSIVGLVKNGGRVKPGLADTAIPSLAETLPDAKIP